ncbi:MAG TPA: colanic acid biosynthesis pyruvyl transferase WcaK [Dongiaceae bacterium]|nr:colanic acid biosynthesis pyruvyl transferase WcaK [Dongiaceae bacterium]
MTHLTENDLTENTQNTHRDTSLQVGVIAGGQAVNIRLVLSLELMVTSVDSLTEQSDATLSAGEVDMAPPAFKSIAERGDARTKVLLIGNHACGNRGDGAIARGLIEALEEELPAVEIVMTSRYPVSSAFLLGRPVESDLFDKLKLGSGRVGSLARRALPYQLLLAVKNPNGTAHRSLPASVRERIDYLRGFDAVIQVGGSFFVDLYGVRQFEAPFAAVLAGTPLFLLGHSMGPLGGRTYRAFVRELLLKARRVTIREPISLGVLREARLPLTNVKDGSDTAWLVRRASAHLTDRRGRKGRVAISVRELAPFHHRLNTTQEAYECAFALLVDALIDDGYEVVAVSTCTGIESYHRDDRISALRVKARVRRSDRLTVIMDELNDVELGQLFSTFDLLVGTRLHSAIIALSFGTPAIAISYEHKSQGTMQQLGLPMLTQPVSALLDGTLVEHVRSVLRNIDDVVGMSLQAVAAERARASSMIKELTEDLMGLANSARQ